MFYYKKLLTKFGTIISLSFKNCNAAEIIEDKFDEELVDESDATVDFYICFDTHSNLSTDIRTTLQSAKEFVVVHGGTDKQRVMAKKANINNKNYFYIPKNNQYIEKYENYIHVFSSVEFDSNCLRIIREVLYRLCLTKGMIALHGGAIEYKNGEAALIVGAKGAGKSTLICKLLKKDKCIYIDNDRVLIGTVSDNVVAYGMSGTINIGRGTMKEYGDIFLDCIYSLKNDQDKHTFTTNEFILRMKCDYKKQCIISKVLFPCMDTNSSILKYYSSDRTVATEILENQFERVDNDEHPDWLEICSISEYEHEHNIKKIVDRVIKSVSLEVVSVGIGGKRK